MGASLFYRTDSNFFYNILDNFSNYINYYFHKNFFCELMFYLILWVNFQF